MKTFALVRAILSVVLGAIFTLVAMVWGIAEIASGMFEDRAAYDLDVRSAAFELPLKRVDAGETLSFWLQQQGREIENEPLAVHASLKDDAGNTVAEFGEDFRFGYLRHSDGTAQFYRLGKHTFESPFSGTVRLNVEGDRDRLGSSRLVVRSRIPFALPYAQAGLFFVGLGVMLYGVVQMMKMGRARRDGA